MALWRKSGKRALDQFRAFAQNTRRFESGKPLASGGVAEDLLYAANPVYIDVTQGGVSSIRGFGSLMFLAMASGILYAVWLEVLSIKDGFFDPNNIIDVIIALMMVLFLAAGILLVLFAILPFLAPADAVVRFDRKRQMVYKWSDQGLIEIPWANLTPVVQGTATSAMQVSRTYRGMFVEYAANGEPRTTNGVPHLMMVGPLSGGEEGSLYYLEYVRRYMEQGLSAVPRPRQWLRHRPGWRAMFNFAGMVDNWHDPVGVGRPWGAVVIFGVGSLMMFPMQMTHWLSLKVAPKQKWPAKLKAQHANDLAQIGCLPDGRRDPASARRPLMRGQANASDSPWPAEWANGPEPETAPTTGSGARYWLAACIAVPLAFLSPLIFWLGVFQYLPILDLSIYEMLFWSTACGMTATAITLLSIPKPSTRQEAFA